MGAARGARDKYEVWMRIVAAPEHYTDFAAVVDGEPPEAIFETGTASISCSSTFAGNFDFRIG